MPIQTTMGSAASTTGARADDLVRITPELVLVDPDLSRRVRPRVPLLFLRRRPPRPVLPHGSQHARRETERAGALLG